jgi:chromodomain-helicase-DNA-binding protein 7
MKSFIWELIAPSENGEARVDRNHSGLAAPIQRGGRKNKKESKRASKGSASVSATTTPNAPLVEGAEWTRDEKYDPEQNLDSGYRRHVTRHANKVLLRIRMLYYIKQEIIRDLESQVT